MFSDVAPELTGSTNDLYCLHEALRSGGIAVTDLIRGNTTEHGLGYPTETLSQIVCEATEHARYYRPDPFGQRIAREAIAQYYRPLAVSPEQILLTPGTSISYWYCFKLLANPEDEILCPSPCYPLLEYIAKLCGVHLKHYLLAQEHDWAIDLAQLEKQITPRTRAIVLISPHNPTGKVLAQNELDGIANIAAKHDLPILFDEVFSHFVFQQPKLPRLINSSAPLVFTLNGLSKNFALPGLKLGWIAISGTPALIDRAHRCLEMISDTFLPVSEITQFAAPSIFARSHPFLDHYIGSVAQLRALALEEFRDIQFTPPAGGFYLVLPLQRPEEEVALQLLEREHLLVHPGYFYDIEGNHLVLTFIQERERLKQALQAIRRAICEH